MDCPGGQAPVDPIEQCVKAAGPQARKPLRANAEGLTPGEQVIARAGAFFSTGDQVRAAP